jgi:hypothetical protein
VISVSKQRLPKPFPAWFVVAWVVCALIGLGLIGVAVWAVISLVSHVTG